MNNDYNSKSFKDWLDKLQQESWQLELIISGFAIYGLSQVLEPLKVYINITHNENNPVIGIALTIGLISCSILMFTLLVHVILRGLWIGALGLRYVSGDIDYKELNYRPKFDRYLRKRMGSFDKYISRLEDYCSVLFAISFLLVFYVITFFLYVGIIALIGYFLIDDNETKNAVLFYIGITLMFFVVIGMLLTFIDFVTQGYLKKKKWLAKIYFPFYWVFSYLTLSFLYRPLVHNFLDNRFGKRLSLILVPIYFLIIGATSYTFKRSNYFSSSNSSNTYTANSLNYDDNINEEGIFVKTASIPSKIIKTTYLPVFINYRESVEDAVFRFNEGLKPEEDKRGFNSDFIAGFNNFNLRKNTDSLRTEYMKTLSEIYSFKIDTLEYKNLELLFTKHRNKQDGFETVLSLKTLIYGKHDLKIYRLRKVKDSIVNRRITTIPFWYYPD